MRKLCTIEATVWNVDGELRVSFAIPNETIKAFASRPEEKDLDLNMDMPKPLPIIETTKELKIGPTMEAIVRECKLDAKALGPHEWKLWRGILKMWGGKDDEALAREVTIRCNVYRSKFPGCALTVNALHKHWAALIYIPER